jgi:hypothetical protein
MSSLWVHFTLVHSTPSITLSYPFTFHTPFSTAFNTYPYILYLHSVTTLLMFDHSLFHLHQVTQSSSTITNMFYI